MPMIDVTPRRYICGKNQLAQTGEAVYAWEIPHSPWLPHKITRQIHNIEWPPAMRSQRAGSNTARS